MRSKLPLLTFTVLVGSKVLAYNLSKADFKSKRVEPNANADERGRLGK